MSAAGCLWNLYVMNVMFQTAAKSDAILLGTRMQISRFQWTAVMKVTGTLSYLGIQSYLLGLVY